MSVQYRAKPYGLGWKLQRKSRLGFWRDCYQVYNGGEYIERKTFDSLELAEREANRMMAYGSEQEQMAEAIREHEKGAPVEFARPTEERKP